MHNEGNTAHPKSETGRFMGFFLRKLEGPKPILNKDKKKVVYWGS
jgi:hypothetical protein